MFNSVDPLSEATVTLAEIMTEWGEWEYAEKLLRNKSIPPALDKRVKFCLIQQGWASGSFNKSFALSAQMGESTQALFFRGVSLFFECQWYEASRDFTAIYTHFPKSRLGARAQCMASTIHAICGGDMQKVHETIEQACKLLNDYDDVSGLWSAWNNLGEIYLKKGNYSLARIYLKKALAFSCKLQVERTTSETIRNLIELGLREGNYFTNETTQLIEKLESTPLTTYLQKMQTFNTLALCYLRSRNIKKAASYLKSVIQTPGEKKGYYMYTLSHLSLLAKRVGRDEQGNVLLQRAVDRARHEGHLLALEQIKQDHYG